MEFNYATYSDSPLKAIRDTQDAKVQETLIQSILDPVYFVKTFFPDTFDDAFSHQHLDFWNLLTDDTLPRVGCCAWRKFGKTTSVWAKVIWNTVFRRSPFTMWVSSEADIASEQLDGVKEMLMTNYDIKHCFGDLKPMRGSVMDKSFAKKSWFVTDPITNEAFAFFLPKGVNQKVRGVNVVVNNRKQRPTLILPDDLEDDQEVYNEELREKMRNWFDRSLLECVPRALPDPKTNKWKRKENDPFWIPPWRVIYTDSFKHEDAIMAHVLTQGNAGWSVRRFAKAVEKKDSAGDMRWYSAVPELFTNEDIRNEIRNAKASNKFDGWCFENLCLPGAAENNPWRREGFQYYHERTNTFIGANDSRMPIGRDINRDPDIRRFIIVDPARCPNPKSAYTAMLAVAYDSRSGNIYLRDLINERLSMEEIVDRAFEMAVATNSTTICPEITGLNEWIQHPFQNENILKNYGKELFWLKAQALHSGDYGKGKEASKRARASTLIPYYRKNRVWHEQIIEHSALEQQMLSYPRPAKWDALDCAGYIPFILMESGCFAEPQIIRDIDEDGNEMPTNHDLLGAKIRARAWECC